MARAEPTTATGEQVSPSNIDGGVSRPILEFPTDRELVAGASGDGKSDTVGVDGPPRRVSLRPLADSDGERRRHEMAYEPLYTGADKTRGNRADPEHVTKPDPLALGTPGAVRQVQRRPALDFDVNAVADDRGRNRRPERGEVAPEGL